MSKFETSLRAEPFRICAVAILTIFDDMLLEVVSLTAETNKIIVICEN